MSIGPYPRYRETSPPLPATVPVHWRTSAFKRLASVQNGADYKHIASSEGIPVYGSGGPFAYATEWMYEGSSVLLGRKGTVDRPIYVSGRFWCVDTMFWTKIAADSWPRYVYYLAATIPFGLYSTNTALPSMAKGDLENHPVVSPPLDEQVAIATFLDRETTKIDALIAEQERLIALLQEKRQAAISNAVTKGLDPNVPMKDSGVDWIGQVPAHWQVLPGRRIASPFSTESISDDALRSEGEIMYLKVSSLPDDRLALSESDWFVDHDAFATSAPRGFVVFPKRGAAISLNRVNVVSGQALLDPNLMGWMPREGMSLDYLAFALKARRLTSLADVSTIPQLNNKHIDPAPFPVPPEGEQVAIADRLHHDLAVIDALQREAAVLRKVLGERRTALITAAVTGQIDVRGLVETAA